MPGTGFRSQKNHFFVRTLDLDAMSFDHGIVFEGLVNDAAIKGAQGFEFDNVTPAANFLGGILRLLDQLLAGLSAVTADIDHDFWNRRVLLKEQAVGDVLQVRKRLSLASNQSPRVVTFHIQKNSVVHAMFFDGDLETEQMEQFFESCFGFSSHVEGGCLMVAG